MRRGELSRARLGLPGSLCRRRSGIDSEDIAEAEEDEEEGDGGGAATSLTSSCRYTASSLVAVVAEGFAVADAGAVGGSIPIMSLGAENGRNL